MGCPTCGCETYDEHGACKSDKALVALIEKVRGNIKATRAVLGHDLRGYSPVDLIADRYPYLPLDTVRYIVERAEEK